MTKERLIASILYAGDSYGRTMKSLFNEYQDVLSIILDREKNCTYLWCDVVHVPESGSNGTSYCWSIAYAYGFNSCASKISLEDRALYKVLEF